MEYVSLTGIARLRYLSFYSGEEEAVLRYSDIQSLANRTTWDEAGIYRRHREETMKSLRQGAGFFGSPATLLVVGAGNANDLDLTELLGLAGEVWLADMDRAAMERALVRQGLHQGERDPGRKGVHLWIGDAGGTAAGIDAFRQTAARIANRQVPHPHPYGTEHLSQPLSRPPSELLPESMSGLRSASSSDRLRELLRRLAEKAMADPSPEVDQPDDAFPSSGFDLVVSQCVLSQILWPVTEMVWETTGIYWQDGQRELTLERGKAFYGDLAFALRQLTLAHLGWLWSRLRPGGVLVFNTDVVWQGIPLYATDVEAALAGVTDARRDFWIARKLLGKEEWEWQLDENTRAVVRSYHYRKDSAGFASLAVGSEPRPSLDRNF